MRFTTEDIARITQGQVRRGPSDTVCDGANVDSRTILPGQLFVAHVGERVDGHDFVHEALSRGAAAALVEYEVDVDIPQIVVGSSVQALGALAAAARRSWDQATVIALTGSSGKTTTKDLLAHIMRSEGVTVAPQGSFNTEFGVPLTILSAPPDVQFVVLEMGMRGLSHIRYLADIADPDIAMVLNVGSAHAGMLEGSGTIAQAKGEIVEGLRANSTAVLNSDDPQVRAMNTRTSANVFTFGEASETDVRAVNIRLDHNARASFDLQIADFPDFPVSLNLVGEHQVANALGAAACAYKAGIEPGVIAHELSRALPESGLRMEIHDLESGVRVIADCYNANPESMRAALKSLRAMGRPSWAVLGEMKELGSQSVAAHDELGRLAVRLDIGHLICVGEGTKVMYLAACNEGSWADEAAWVPTSDDAYEQIVEGVRPGDVILVKASRSVGLEHLVNRLLTDPWRKTS